jgi:hypothetical protein
MPEPRTSPEKVRELLDKLPDVVNGSGSEGLIAIHATARAMRLDIGQMIADMLPSEPAELDIVLATLAIHALQSRSDGATELEIDCKGGTIVELLERHPDTDYVVVHIGAGQPVSEPDAETA